MVIRLARQNDLDEIVHLYSHLHDKDVAPDYEHLANIWAFIMDNPNRYIYLVAEADNRLVATCNLSIIPNLTRGGKSIALIENVVTHASYRRRGAGRALLTKAIAIARENDCYKAMLMTNVLRKDAHEFYEQVGFSSSDKIAFSMKL